MIRLLLPLFFLLSGVCGGQSMLLGAAAAVFPGSFTAAAFPLAVQVPTDPKSHESIGWLLLGGAALVTAVGALLAFMRRESRMQEPKVETKVSGGPVTIRHEQVFVERHEHAGLQSDLEKHKREIWDVVKGLRAAVGRIETNGAENKVLREANGELLTEVREEVSSLGKVVARLAGIVETKLEAKGK